MNFLQFLKENIVCLDGGMGTLLQAKGLRPGEHPERWNIEHPEAIREVHRAYFDAGTNLVCTNTFGANSLKFSSEELSRMIGAAVENARVAAAESTMTGEKFIALDVGPTGKLLRPFGDLDFEDAVAIFAETIRVGVSHGVDAVFIETMNDSYETRAAVIAAKENCDLPILVSNAYGEDGKLMTGASPEAMVAMLEGLGVSALGANCSLGPRQLRGVAERLLACASVPVILKPNAGLPRSVDGVTVFDVTHEEFADEVADLVSCGVRLAGGCCGTTPAYIEALSKRLAALSPVALVPQNRTVVSSYTHAVAFGGSPILIGERINPTGKKRFKQALLENDMDYILSEGVNQQERGVHILDVNVGLPDIDEPRMLTDAVCGLQSIIDLPLQIDTADPIAMERALRRYNGKAMINSVSGKQESMNAIFPLVKKYGGVVVALTLDEKGIPDTAEGRVAIAERILARAAEFGIDKKDIIFDTLAMTVSAEPRAAAVTLGALEIIRRDLGCHTSLGVSNVSFGLPARDAVNATFFALALERGLSAAIMNPYSADMIKTYYAFRALRGLDPNCADYVEAAAGFVTSNTTATISPALENQSECASALQRAIVKGMSEQAGQLTKTLLETQQPLDIVQSHVIPALDIVGRGFEQRIVYLPGLLMSAEAAKTAFEVIKSAMPTEATAGRGKIVIATVHGDIHDIGKNIVKLLLENYGFEVTDLGRDVPPETVVEAVERLHAPIVGLSALMTTTVPAMAETVKLIRERTPWCRTMVGGAVLNRDYAEQIGADAYAHDAMEAVRCAEELMARG